MGRLVVIVVVFLLFPDIGTSEQDGVNNAFILYDGCDGKSDSDDESSEDHLRADEREMKPENEIASGKFILMTRFSILLVSKYFDLKNDSASLVHSTSSLGER